MFKLVKDIYERRELLHMLVVRNLKIRYKNSSLGFFWSLIVPIFLIVIYSVFLGLLKVPIPLPVLVTGIIVWQFLAMCLGDSLSTITGNAPLVQKTAFPKIILPLSMTIANLVNFLLSLFVLFVFLLITKATIGAILWLPLIMITQLALCLGMALILSSMNVFFRDTEHLISLILLAWFFLSPIIYPVSFAVETIPARLLWLKVAMFLNPMTGIVTAYRHVLISTPNPGNHLVVISFLMSWLVLLIGVGVFQKFQPQFADEL